MVNPVINFKNNSMPATIIYNVTPKAVMDNSVTVTVIYSTLTFTH